MGRIRLAIRTSFGEISLEGDSLLDFSNSLIEIGASREEVDSILKALLKAVQIKELGAGISVSVTPSKPEWAGVIEYGSDGSPHISVASDKLTAKEVVGLLLYAKSPNALSMSELTALVANNWKNVDGSYVSANLGMMKAYVIKEGAKGSFVYRLSGSGKYWVENELLPKLRPKAESK